MSWTFEERGQRLKGGVSSDGRPSLAYSINYLFTDNSATALSVREVLSVLGLRPGTPFADDPNATLGEVDINRLPTRAPHCAWDVDVNFATNAKVPETSDNQDPTQQRVKRSKRFKEITKYIIRDRLGMLIVNSAGVPFPGGVPVVIYPHTFVYDWARRIPTRGFHGTINKNKFNECEPGTLLCLITSEEVYEGSYHFWRETIEMAHDPDGWQPSPVNAGLKELKYTLISGSPSDLDTIELRDCVDGNGQKCTEPQPLYDGTATSGGGPDYTKRKGMMVPLDDRPDGCTFIDVDHLRETEFEKIGVQEFPE